MEDNRTIHKRTDFLGLLTSRDIDYGTIVFTGDRTIDNRTNDYQTVDMARCLKCLQQDGESKELAETSAPPSLTKGPSITR